MKGSWSRFLAAALLIAAAAILLQARSRSEIFPQREPLSQFPAQLAGWTGADVPMDKEVLEVLGPGDFLFRIYQNQNKPNLYLDLFIAYFRSQRTGDTIHSPQHCLPGAGWIPVEQSRITIAAPGHAPFPANRFVIAKGESRQLVLYWYWAHDRGVASDYLAKYYLVADSIRMNRSDGSLIRLITPIYPGETSNDAEQRLMPFASQVVPLLGSYIPR